MKKKLKIVIFTPDRFNQILAGNILHRHGHETIKPKTITETIEVVRNDNPDVLIVEIWGDNGKVMGVSEVEEILKMESNIKVILTASMKSWLNVPRDVLVREMAELLNKGANDIVSQPFENNNFMHVLDFVMYQQKPRQIKKWY